MGLKIKFSHFAKLVHEASPDMFSDKGLRFIYATMEEWDNEGEFNPYEVNMCYSEYRSIGHYNDDMGTDFDNPDQINEFYCYIEGESFLVTN